MNKESNEKFFLLEKKLVQESSRSQQLDSTNNSLIEKIASLEKQLKSIFLFVEESKKNNKTIKDIHRLEEELQYKHAESLRAIEARSHLEQVSIVL